MANPVAPGILLTGPFPRPANITPHLTLVEVANLPLPSTPTESPREILTLENRVVILKKPTALDIAEVKKLMREAREQIAQNHQAEGIRLYQKVSDLLSSSMLDTKALLISVSCYILLANFSRSNKATSNHFLEKARVHLKQISKKLWDPMCPERKNCRFMYSLGCDHLAIYYNSSDSEPHQKTMNYFDAAIKLLSKASSEPLKHRVFLGQCLAYLYDVRRTITAKGTHCEREELIKKLKLSRDFLETSLKFCKVDHNLHYLHALIRSIIVLLLEEERLSSSHLNNDKQIEKHWQEAKKLLEEIPEKNGNMLALLASLQYKKAGYQAFLNLVEAQDLFDQPKTSLKLAAGDAIRQIAWVLPLEVIQHKAELFVKSAALEDNSFQLVSKLNLYVFYCQRALWNLIAQVKKHANGAVEHDTTKIERIPLEQIDKKQLIENIKLQFQVLELINNQSEVDRLKSAPDNVQLLEELHLQSLKQLSALEELSANDRIEMTSFMDLKRLIKSDLALIEALKKINLSLLRGNAILMIKSHFGMLKSLVNFDGVPSFFFLLLKSLRTTLELIEDELPKLYYLPQTPAERIAYNSLILKIGNQLDAICVFFNFKHLSMDLLQDFNVTLEPELEEVYEIK